MRISEIMTRDPVCCEPDTPLQTVCRMMCDNDCGEIPVVESMQNPRPIGVITDRDVVCRILSEGKNPLDFAARDAMTSPVISINPDATIDDALALLQENQIRRILVVDDQGQCVGIVAQADIATKHKSSSTAEMVKEVSHSMRT